MCGIAGLIQKTGARPIDAATLSAMCAALAHRGPDGDGFWLSPDARVGFAHRRLAIIDLSDAAAQPMRDVDGRACVTFNGEIYNHRELRRDLEAHGRPFRTDHSDTEVLLQGYLAWGIEGLLARLNGIFAFALFDASSGATYLVRDQIGVKPLYFSWGEDGALAFASEIKAILARTGARRELNAAAAYHYLTFMAAPAPETLFAGVHKLPAGAFLRINAEGEVRTARYFAPWPSNALDALSESDRILSVRETLFASVKRQLLADVPVGLFLSGGVDSTALLAIATQITGEPLRTFSVGFADPSELDETARAAEIAHRFGAQHTDVRIDAADVANALDALVVEQDEPLADWVCLPLRAVARVAHEAGLKTVLCGEGADEQFCGYDHYLRYLDLAQGPHKWLSTLQTLGLGRGAAALADAFGGRDLRRSFHADFLRRAALGQEAFWGGAIVFTDGMKRGIWSGTAPAPPANENLAALSPYANATESSALVGALLGPLDTNIPNAEQLQRMIWLEFAQRLPELLLMRVDKMCMAASLEARVPFLDLDMVQLAAQFGQASKIGANKPKRLLKRALEGVVPDDVINRRKQGFGAPMKDWLCGPLGVALRTRLAESSIYQTLPLDRAAVLSLIDMHREGQRDYAVYIWTLFNLAAWHDHWIAR